MDQDELTPTAVPDTPVAPENIQIEEPANALPVLAAADLPESWRQAMGRAGWTDLTPVQSRAIPYVLAGRDLLVQSRTGSGKTGAFVLPILERINPRLNACQALVLAPTRELAQQVSHDAALLAGDSGIRVTAVYGGVGYGQQLDAFRQGAHLVVGTPGRVLDHLIRRSLSLESLQILVFDEADRLLSMGFYQDMLDVKHYLPAKGVNGYMFSATFPIRVKQLAKQFLREPDFLGLSSDNVHVVETEHCYYITPGMDKDRSLVRIIEVENPESAIIFCNTRDRVQYVTVVLQRFGYDADSLSSDLSQKDRDRVLNRVRQGTLRFLVATDVAARGIDIPELSHVIQYEPPEDPELYIHRAGRTGRAGASGVAITLVNELEDTKLRRIARQYEIELQLRPLPADEDVAAVVGERTTVFLETKLRARDKLQTERMRRFVPQAQTLAESEDGLTLLAMLLDDYYQATMYKPPPIKEPEEVTRPSARPTDDNKRRRRSGRRGPKK
ncbi:MAG: DEAD/DEAH box helicase [Anaerolineae bacterium]|nr:DEAD/DEAH box helicase [Anaerolineae bacterium]